MDSAFQAVVLKNAQDRLGHMEQLKTSEWAMLEHLL